MPTTRFTARSWPESAAEFRRILDEMEIMRWASKFEIYEEMKEDLDNTLSLLERYALPVPA